MPETKDEQLDRIEALLREQKDKKEKEDKKIEYVDLSALNIVKASVSEQQEYIKTIFNAKPSFGVVCAQSGYKASLSSLVYKDIIAITNSNLTNYESKQEIYKVIFSKITGYSVKDWNPTFEQWLKETSLGDVESLIYGIYCSTFQDKSSVNYTCPFCGVTNNIEIDNNKLIRVNDKKEMFDLTDAISRESTSYEKMKEFSLISDKKENYKSIILPDSKLIVSLKLPSLYDTLSFLRTFTEEQIANKSSDSINICLGVNKLLIPSKDNTYSEVKKISDIFELIDLLSLDDYSVIKKVVYEMLEDKHITYIIEHQKCNKCGKEIEQIPMDIESLLFFQISEKQLS